MEYKSEIYKVMHQDAIADFEVGAISETRMKEYDKMCLVREPETACEEKRENSSVIEHVTA
jgi:DNA-binding transcriptional regulator YiaG